jgi:hypothetical protein
MDVNASLPSPPKKSQQCDRWQIFRVLVQDLARFVAFTIHCTIGNCCLRLDRGQSYLVHKFMLSPRAIP